jgi:hypothetical protein
VTKYIRLRHKTRDPKTNNESANQSNVFQDADCCFHVQRSTTSVTSAGNSPFNSLASSFSHRSRWLLSSEMRCRILSYVHTNVSQENSASIFTVGKYFTVDKKASHSSETFVSTKLHGVICRSTIISVPSCSHRNVLLRLISIPLFLLTLKSFFQTFPWYSPSKCCRYILFPPSEHVQPGPVSCTNHWYLKFPIVHFLFINLICCYPYYLLT